MTASVIWRAWFYLLLAKTTHATPNWRKLIFWKWPSGFSETFLPLQSKVCIISWTTVLMVQNMLFQIGVTCNSRHWSNLLLSSPDSADSYREGYKACLQRVSALLPKTSIDQDACQRVKEFIQQSMSATVTPTCLNCCAHSSRTLPQIQQRIQSLKFSFSSRLESQSRSSSSVAVAPSGAQPGPQPVSAAMWRPW